MSIGNPFLPGRAKTGGRQRGVRNRLSHAFLTDLLEEWSEHGRETLEIARIERPVEFAKMVAGLCPKEFELEVSGSITAISDDELERFISYCRDQIAAGDNARVVDARAEPTPDGEPARLLQAIPDPAKIS